MIRLSQNSFCTTFPEALKFKRVWSSISTADTWRGSRLKFSSREVHTLLYLWKKSSVSKQSQDRNTMVWKFTKIYSVRRLSAEVELPLQIKLYALLRASGPLAEWLTILTAACSCQWATNIPRTCACVNSSYFYSKDVLTCKSWI